MKAYIGTKIIKAVEMGEREFDRKFKGKDLKEGQLSRTGYMVEYPDGYKSWSPKKTFEDAYREISDTEISIIDSTISCDSESV
ncbi:MAG: hypothetical protein KAT14_08585 [Candidatus Marinimicrobia bacterium]|nr:hypothetical protein [Candidatus Neomarinimicrobiota bacterium]